MVQIELNISTQMLTSSSHPLSAWMVWGAYPSFLITPSKAFVVSAAFLAFCNAKTNFLENESITNKMYLNPELCSLYFIIVLRSTSQFNLGYN